MDDNVSRKESVSLKIRQRKVHKLKREKMGAGGQQPRTLRKSKGITAIQEGQEKEERSQREKLITREPG